jgi:hypothetical protein
LAQSVHAGRLGEIRSDSRVGPHRISRHNFLPVLAVYLCTCEVDARGSLVRRSSTREYTSCQC